MTNLSEKLKRVFGTMAYGAGVALDSVSGGEGVLGIVANLSKGIGTEFLADVGESDFESFGKWLKEHKFNTNFAKKLERFCNSPALREVVVDIIRENAKKRVKNTFSSTSGHPNKDPDITAKGVATLSRVWLCQYDQKYIENACKRSEKFNGLDKENKARILEILEVSCSAYLEDAYDKLDKNYKVIASVIIRTLGSQITDLADAVKNFVDRHPINADEVTFKKATVTEILYEAYTLKCPFCGNVYADTLSSLSENKYRCESCETIFFCAPASSWGKEELEHFIASLAEDILTNLSSLIKDLNHKIDDNFNRLSAQISSEGEKTRAHISSVGEKNRSEILSPARNAKDLLRKELQEEHLSKEYSDRFATSVINVFPDDMLANFTLKFLSGKKGVVPKFLSQLHIDEGDISDVDVIVDVILRYPKKEYLGALNSFIERIYKDKDKGKFSELNAKIKDISKELDTTIYNLRYKRDVFIAYSNEDIGDVEDLVHYLEEQDPRTKLRCFVAYRNLPHCFVENYENDIYTAMDNCSAFIFVSSKNSRDSGCFAVVELTRFADTKPDALRIEYLIDDYVRPYSGSDDYIKQLFAGKEYCVKGSYQALVQRLLRAKFSSKYSVAASTVPLSSAPVFSTNDTPSPLPDEPKKPKPSDRKSPSPKAGATPMSATPARKQTLPAEDTFARDAIIENGVLKKYNGSANEVVIPDSVTSIGDRAFYGCSSLSSITIPSSVKSIGREAFACCASLSSIIIPNSITLIGYEAFKGCPSLSSITIPSSVIYIGDQAFEDCSSLSSITAHENNTVYRSEGNCLIERKTNKLFAGCKNSTIPFSIKSIGRKAFKGCSSLSSINIPSSVTYIGDEAFYGCSSLSSINIPDSVKSIGSQAFRGCSSLSSITIPGSVPHIGDEAFGGCSSLSSIIIPNSVKSIGSQAFRGCSSLSSITIPNSVKNIGRRAFYGCSSLSKIYYRGSQAQWLKISKAADWDNATGAYDIVYSYTANSTSKSKSSDSKIPSPKAGVTPMSATPARKHTLPADDAFARDAIIKNGVLRKYNGSATDVVIPDFVTSIDEFAFSDCSSLSSITIPSSVTSIGDWAFFGCSSLSSITIPSSVKSIGIAAFEECTSLSSITIPSLVTSIGDRAFAHCSSLTSITVHEYNTVYRSEGNCLIERKTNKVLAGCKNSTIPHSAKCIGFSAFAGCADLTSISISNSVTSISDWAFAFCTSLSSITIPDSVKYIGIWAFRNCSSLSSIAIPSSVKSIGEAAFEDCTSLRTIRYGGTKMQWILARKGSLRNRLQNNDIENCQIIFNAK